MKATQLSLDCGGKFVDLSCPVVMGVLNVTPDSFSDGGVYVSPEIAIQHGLDMVAEGAAILDIGGESTRPGAQSVTAAQELDRVVPIIEALSAEVSVPLSIDTNKPEVMRAAVAAGAGMINDVLALQAPGALKVAAETNVPVCLMHMQGLPRTMQEKPVYDDVQADVMGFLQQRIKVCEAAGIATDKLLIDPGIGFGKTLEHNLTLLRQLDDLTGIGLPVLVGVSRKSMFGQLLDRPVEDRMPAGLAVAVLAAEMGVAIIRTHDVKETVDALAVTVAIIGNRLGDKQ